MCVVLLATGCGEEPTVGQMLSVVSYTATVNGAEAAPGDIIPPAATVATDGAGVARFHLTTGNLTCHIFQNGAIEVPDQDSVLRFDRGMTYCTVAGPTDREIRVETERFNVRFTDARFGIDLARDDPLVYVDRGEMRLETFAGAERKQVDVMAIAANDQQDSSASEEPSAGGRRQVAWLIRSDGTARRIDPPLAPPVRDALQWLVGVELLEQAPQPSPLPTTRVTPSDEQGDGLQSDVPPRPSPDDEGSEVDEPEPDGVDASDDEPPDTDDPDGDDVNGDGQEGSNGANADDEGSGNGDGLPPPPEPAPTGG